MEVRAFSVPLTRPLSTAGGDLEQREGYLVTIEHAGVRGVGEATPLPGWTERLDVCRVGLDIARTTAREEDWGVALSESDMPAARHGVSLALADAKATAVDEPLYRYLGGNREVRSVPVNATVGDGHPDDTRAAVERTVAEGFDAVKVKVGSRPVEADLARLRRARDAAGESVELRADANGAWTPEEAADAIEGMADLGVSYVEQPLPPDDLAGHADLRGRGVGIALDESLRSHSLDAITEAGAADVVIVKPMVLGGPDIARRIAGRAIDAGLSAVVTTTIDAVVARTAAVHVAASLPDPPACGLATAGWLAEDLAPDPAPVSDGRITVPQDPGNLGVDPGEFRTPV
ncbi:o-succinylbenzoate synthase [Halobacteriales archaeon QS_1_68_17]|nr:MAG: o-succinylbenzoate synthase [Halobacteriales archaeon QS_1_68_17]